MLTENLMNQNMTKKDLEDHVDMLHALIMIHMQNNNLNEIIIYPPENGVVRKGSTLEFIQRRLESGIRCIVIVNGHQD